MSDFERELKTVDYELLKLDDSYRDTGSEIIEAPRSGVYLGELELTDVSEVDAGSQESLLPIELYAIPNTSLVKAEATPRDIVEALENILGAKR